MGTDLKRLETAVIEHMRTAIAHLGIDGYTAGEQRRRADDIFRDHLVEWSEDFAQLWQKMYEIWCAHTPMPKGQYKTTNKALGLSSVPVTRWIDDKEQPPIPATEELVARFDCLISTYHNDQRGARAMQCEGPGCTKTVEQIPGGHRARKYCSDACRVAAHRLHQQQAKQQKTASSQERFLEEQEAREQEARARLRARYGELLPGTMALLVDLAERSFHSDLVDVIAQAVVAERIEARQSSAAEHAALAEEIMLGGETLGFCFLAIEDGDLFAGVANWSRVCAYGSIERLYLVREAVQIKLGASQRRARLAQL